MQVMKLVCISEHVCMHTRTGYIKLAMRKSWLFQMHPSYLKCLPLRFVNGNNKTEFNRKLNLFKLKR